jgi:hypothetical protein
MKAQGRLIWRQVRQQLVVIGTTVGLISLIALLLAMVAAGLLAGREELRHADFVLVLAPLAPPPALVEHSFELYRRGFVSQVLVLGEGRDTLAAELIAQGLPEAALLAEPPGAELSQLRALAAADEFESVLVVVAPAAQLRTLKQLRDQGWRVYHVPVRAEGPAVSELLEASLYYWRYVLGGA